MGREWLGTPAPVSRSVSLVRMVRLYLVPPGLVSCVVLASGDVDVESTGNTLLTTNSVLSSASSSE